MQRIIPGILFLLLGLNACATSETKVEFNQVLVPHVAEIGKLAVVLDGEINAGLKEDIVQGLRKCPLYTDIKVIEKPLNFGKNDVSEAFDAHISKYAKGSGGLLRIRMEHVETSEESEKSLSFLLFDQTSYDWFPSYGGPRLGTMGFAESMEIGPEVVKRRRSPLVKTSRYQQVYRMSYYRKSSGKMLYDRVGKNISAFSVFSRDPTFKKAAFEDRMRASLLKDIAFYSCPPSEAVTRHLYSMGSSSASSRTIDAGIDLAKDGQWTEASAQWMEVLSNDSKNVLAHHNLGVYYEQLGDVTEALKHYRVGFRDKRITEDAFGMIIGRFLPQNEAMESVIVQVTGGSWIFVDVPEGEKRTKASVFRSTPIIDPDSSRVIGLTLKEIAVLGFVTSQETRRAARLREYLVDTPVRAGDIVVFGDSSSGRKQPASSSDL